MILLLAITTIFIVLWALSYQAKALKKKTHKVTKLIAVPFLIFSFLLIKDTPRSYHRDQEWFNDTIKVPARLLDQDKWMEPFYAVPFEPSKADKRGVYNYRGDFAFDQLLVIGIDPSPRYNTGPKISPPQSFFFSTPYFSQIGHRFIKLRKRDSKRRVSPIWINDNFIATITRDSRKISIQRTQDLQKPFYYTTFEDQLNYDSFPQKIQSKNFPNQNYFYSRKAKLYRIPYSSKEEMIDISYRQLISILDSNWSLQNSNLSHSIEDKLRKRYDSNQSASKLSFISPISFLKGREVWTLILLSTALCLLSNRHKPLAICLASLILLIGIYIKDYSNSQSNIKALETALKENNSINILRKCIESHDTNFFYKANRKAYTTLFPLAQSQMTKEELILAHNLSFANRPSGYSLNSRSFNTYQKFSFFTTSYKVTLYLPHEDNLHYFHQLTRTFEQIIEAKIKAGETAREFILDSRSLYIQPLIAKQGKNQKFDEFIKEEFIKLEKRLHNNPELAFMEGIY